MKPLDPNPVTDSEIANALRGVIAALHVVDALLEVADERQIGAVFNACPYGSYDDVRLDYDSWLGAVLEGATGLDLGDERAAGEPLRFVPQQPRDTSGWRALAYVADLIPHSSHRHPREATA